MSIDDILQDAYSKLAPHCSSAQLDAQVLLAHVLQKNRSYLRAWPEHTVSLLQQRDFEELLHQRLQGVPVAYLVGYREFWSRDFKVSPDVLIPRPETELLVELCLALIADNQVSNVLELGVGSGAIAITLALEKPAIQVTAVDMSLPALLVAQQNAQRYQVGNLSLQQSDWFSALANQCFDMIVSNPPYIAAEDSHLNAEVRFEPLSALVADDEGLYAIKHIINTAPAYLKQQGYLLIEHGYQQGDKVRKQFTQHGAYQAICSYCDLLGHERVTCGKLC